MCNFCSWIELNGKVYYLNNSCLNTKEGRELKKYLGSQFSEDVVGHWAIDYYFKLKGRGKHKEVNNLKNLKLIPKQIVKDIKSMNMTEITGFIQGVLIKKAYDKLKIIESEAWNEYNKIRLEANKEYNRIESEASNEYDKTRLEAWNEYNKIRLEASKEHNKINSEASKKRYKISSETFWNLFKNKNNRIKAWQ